MKTVLSAYYCLLKPQWKAGEIWGCWTERQLQRVWELKNGPLVWASVWRGAFVGVVGWILCGCGHVLVLCHPSQHPAGTSYTWHIIHMTHHTWQMTCRRNDTHNNCHKYYTGKWEITGSVKTHPPTGPIISILFQKVKTHWSMTCCVYETQVWLHVYTRTVVCTICYCCTMITSCSLHSLVLN